MARRHGAAGAAATAAARLLLPLLAAASLSTACEFDCRRRNRWCGDGSEPEHVDLLFTPTDGLPIVMYDRGGMTTAIDRGADDDPYYTTDGFDFNATVPYRSLDLRNRDITSIAAGGLSCYTMGGGVDETETNLTQAVLLRNNSLTALPSAVEYAACPFLDVSHNLITEVPPDAFALWHGGANLTVYMGYNRVSELSNRSFAFGDGADRSAGPNLNVFLDHNLITELNMTAAAPGVENRVGDANCSTAAVVGFACVGESPFAGFRGGKLSVDLRSNGLGYVASCSFFDFAGAYLWVELSDNVIEELPPYLLTGIVLPESARNLVSSQINLYVNHNRLTEMGQLWFSMSCAAFVNLYLMDNRITAFGYPLDDPSTAHPAVLHNYFGEQAFFFMQFNRVSAIHGRSFATGSPGNTVATSAGVFVYLEHNQLTYFNPEAFDGYVGTECVLWLQRNNITTLGPILQNFHAGGLLTLRLEDNHLTHSSLVNVLHSFTQSAAVLTVNMARNNITMLPPYIIQGAAYRSGSRTYASLNIQLGENPISTVDDRALDSNMSAAAPIAYIQSLTLNLSYVNNGGVSIGLPTTFNLSGVVWADAADAGSLLNVLLEGTGISDPSAAAQPFWQYCNWNVPLAAKRRLTLFLADNLLTAVPDQAFLGLDALVGIDLSRNSISNISPTAFVGSDSVSFSLSWVNLTDNRLTFLDRALLDTVPLAQFSIGRNKIVAVPTARNNIVDSSASSEGNVLQCSQFGPEASNSVCWCNDDNGITYHRRPIQSCEFTLCIRSSALDNGCSPETVINSTSCSDAPWPTCVPLNQQNVPSGQYYDTQAQRFLQVMECSTAFKASPSSYEAAAGHTYLAAYEYEAPTVSSQRQCSICSTCPAGYSTTPCTATSNTKCTKPFQLSTGETVALTLGVTVVALAAAIGWLNARREAKKRKRTHNELEMTELLLGEVTEDRERVVGENERLQQAWQISEDDLVLEGQIGVGAFGTVYRGWWGHIKVAIKVLKISQHDLLELGESTDDFDREVAFMRSLRHPHVLIFFGAGVNAAGYPFLVTELMVKGSLRRHLDSSEPVSWNQRMSFAKDIAAGMRYLHSKATVHRDLKADNCFLDENLRVKVADFGTGKMSTNSRAPTSVAAEARAALAAAASAKETTFTTAAGSMLWLAPEVLDPLVQGVALPATLVTPATDVYSFGVVLWEIWTRKMPWYDLEADDVNFQSTLLAAVARGQRPTLPALTDDVPDVFFEQMQKCWAGDPGARPTFNEILHAFSSEHFYDARSYSK